MSLRKGTMPIGLLPHLLLFWHGSDAFFWNTLSSSLWTFRCNLPSTKTPEKGQVAKVPHTMHHHLSFRIQIRDVADMFRSNIVYTETELQPYEDITYLERKRLPAWLIRHDEIWWSHFLMLISLVSRCLQQVTTGSPSCMLLLLWIGSSANSRTAAIPKSARFGSSNALATEINAATPTKTQIHPKKRRKRTWQSSTHIVQHPICQISI